MKQESCTFVVLGIKMTCPLCGKMEDGTKGKAITHRCASKPEGKKAK